MPDITLTIQPPAELALVVTPPAPVATQLSIGQGPAGPQGVQGDRGDAIVELVAAAVLNGHRAIATNAAGLAVHADAATLAHGLAIVGVAETAAALGDPVLVRAVGTISFSGWAWVAGPVFLGLDGVLTQSMPPSAVMALVLGYGAGQVLTLNIQPAIALQ